ncbi:MAG TPA: hypothetical protein P5563_13465, partial [Saprospiraceae bacterium]|nr:hypothetical protein [Saprospiraceae bacterium]
MKKHSFLLAFGFLAMAALLITSCSKDDNGTAIEFKDKSVNDKLVSMFPAFSNVEVYSLISSDDVLPGSPDFIFGAQPDGAGLLKDPNSDGYIMLNNHEIHRAVSRVMLDKTFTPISGEYIVDGDGGMTRLCSATLATFEEHGFGPIFLTAGESGADSRVHAIDPFGPASDKKRTDRVVPALGRASMENAVPLPKDAYPGAGTT